MSVTLKVKRSSTPGAVPTLEQLALGELAVNTANGSLFFRGETEVFTLGETGADGSATLSDDTVSEVKLNVSNAPINGYVLTAQSGDTGGLTWAEAPSGSGGGSGSSNIDGGSATTTYTETQSINGGAA